MDVSHAFLEAEDGQRRLNELASYKTMFAELEEICLNLGSNDDVPSSTSKLWQPDQSNKEVGTTIPFDDRHARGDLEFFRFSLLILMAIGTGQAGKL